MASPAERKADADRRATPEYQQVRSFADGVDFPLDDFQLAACEALEAGRGVLVAAPTGAGKTWSASSRSTWRWPPAASASTPRRSRRCPTRSTPTSSRRHGADRVGLLTGDNVVNGEAPVVVMTTEVLRNMLYAGLARPSAGSATW